MEKEKIIHEISILAIGIISGYLMTNYSWVIGSVNGVAGAGLMFAYIFKGDKK